MIPYPNIDPNIFSIGPVHIRWYGLMYIAGFVSSYFLIGRQKRARELELQGEALQDLFFHAIVGLMVGARLGYLFFYQYAAWRYYVSNPVEIIAVWHGGMSFHGGMLGALAGGWLYCRKRSVPFLAAADCVIVTAPIGLGLGRLANFINAELYGRVTDAPWAMVFPGCGDSPRHPSQLYEAFLEGLVLFFILWFLRKKNSKDGMMIVFFLCFYGMFRFFMEFFREPDAQIGLVIGGVFSMGQLLCVMMIAAGGILACLLADTDKRSGQRPHRSCSNSNLKSG